MRVTKIEELHCLAGWRPFSFLKVSTDEGLVGWSEFSMPFGGMQLSHVIRAMSSLVIGEDPQRFERTITTLAATRVQSNGGLAQIAISAIENALIDIKAKALGIRACDLFGGAVRERVPMYWSHCGTYRLRNAADCNVLPLHTLDDIVKLGEEVKASGYRALKTNTFIFKDGEIGSHRPGLSRVPGHPECNIDNEILGGMADQLAALRQGAGPDIGLMIDLNLHVHPEGLRRVAKTIAPYDMTWLEYDLYDPAAMARLRHQIDMPLASYECLFGRRVFRPYFEAGSADVAIIDVLWNGLSESLKIAAIADSFGVNVAPHNYYSPLASAISGHFSAAVPNFSIMETDVDVVPWHDDIVTPALRVENGCFILPDGPGWGVEVNEEVVRAHPMPAPRAN